jgi:hypothetical protein
MNLQSFLHDLMELNVQKGFSKCNTYIYHYTFYELRKRTTLIQSNAAQVYVNSAGWLP